MKLVYTHENHFFVYNARNLLEAEGIEVVLKNEFVTNAIGETSAFDAWLELWVLDDADEGPARQLLADSVSEPGAPEWKCRRCWERNDASFELCWKCAAPRGA